MYIVYNQSNRLFIGYQQGHWLTTYKRNDAKEFKNKQKAKNIVDMFGQMIPGKWDIYDAQEDLPAPMEEDEESEGLTKRILELSTICEQKAAEASAQVSMSEQELIDVYHYIEFGKFNAAQGYNACRMLQEVLRRRRDAKNNAAVMIGLNDLIKNAKKTITSTPQKRKYTPRVRTDLF